MIKKRAFILGLWDTLLIRNKKLMFSYASANIINRPRMQIFEVIKREFNEDKNIYEQMNILLKRLNVKNDIIIPQLITIWNSIQIKSDVYHDVDTSLETLSKENDLFVLVYGKDNVVDLVNANISKHFNRVFMKENLGLKPDDPRIFSYIVNELKYQNDEIVFVGCSLNQEIMPAKIAGMKTIYLKRHENQFNAKPADYVIDDLTEILEIYDYKENRIIIENKEEVAE